MDTSPAVEAARRFLSLVREGEAPTDAALLAALDRLILAYHDTPEAVPSDTELEAPRPDGSVLYKDVAERFADYGFYPMSDPIASIDKAAMMGDAIDDLVDITSDLSGILWLADHVGLDDAHWSFRLYYFHWGRHARELALYLHARQFG
jgi:hypothetical protein